MKIITKTCSPIANAPQEVLMRPNKYILDDSNLLAQGNKSMTTGSHFVATSAAVVSPDKNSCTALSPPGRQVMYLPTIVYTPVQTSSRSPHNDNKRNSNKSTSRRLLSEDDVDALNTKLENLFIGGDTSSNDVDNNNIHNCNVSKPMGRVTSTSLNYKTCTTTKVLRSARFQK